MKDVCYLSIDMRIIKLNRGLNSGHNVWKIKYVPIINRKKSAKI